MKDTLKVSLFLLCCCCVESPVAFAGPAFDSLSSMAGDEALAPVVFDGRAVSSPVADISNAIVANPAEAIAGAKKSCGFDVPIPAPSPVKYTGELPVSGSDKPFVDRAISALASTASGKPLANFLNNEKIEIKWAPLASTDKEPAYAYACPPEECGGKNVLFLNNRAEYARLYRGNNPTFLAVVLAHELTHLSDYKSMGGGVTDRQTTAGLLLELNGWSTEVYIYHELLKAGSVPLPGAEHAALQAIRLNLAIRDYVNGGTRPSLADFPLLSVIAGIPFDAYIDRVTIPKKQGAMSLAGVVELKYGVAPSFEEMSNPGLFASSSKKSEYKKYKTLKKSLSLSAFEYLKWRNAAYAPAVPVPQPQQPNPGHTHHTHDDDDGYDHGGGDDDGGGFHPGTYNPNFGNI